MTVLMRGPAELELYAHVDTYGWEDSDVDALRWLAAQGCDRETAAQLLLTARRRGVGDLKMYVMMLWAAVKMPDTPQYASQASREYAEQMKRASWWVDDTDLSDFWKNIKIT